MIGTINHGVGNILSVINALKYCTDAQVTVVDYTKEMEDCSKLILLGAFGKAMEKLEKK